MVWAEEKALEHFEKPEGLREKAPRSYLNAKKLNYVPTSPDMSAKDVEKIKGDDPLYNETLELRKNDHFGADVNLTLSSVHVPSSVFDRRGDILG